MDSLHFLADVVLADAAGTSVADVEAAWILLSLRRDGERATTGRKRKRLPSAAAAAAAQPPNAPAADAAEPVRKSLRLESRPQAAPKSVASDSKGAKHKRKMLQEQRTALQWMTTGTPRADPCACCKKRMDALRKNPTATKEGSDRLLPCTDRPDAGERRKGRRAAGAAGAAVMPCARCKYLHSTCSSDPPPRPPAPAPTTAATAAIPPPSSSSASASASLASSRSSSSSSVSPSSVPSAACPSQTGSPPGAEGGEGKGKEQTAEKETRK
ncbi:hypothetical protein VTH06DRAFT_8212 [Thermothelomyces fergusii]